MLKRQNSEHMREHDKQSQLSLAEISITMISFHSIQVLYMDV